MRRVPFTLSVVASLALISSGLVASMPTAAGAASPATAPSAQDCAPATVFSQSQAMQYWQSHKNLPQPGTLAPNGQPIEVVQWCGSEVEQSAPITVAKGSYAHLNVANMSNEQLLKLGLPIPSGTPGSAAWQQWLTEMTALLPKFQSVTPLYFTQTTPRVTDTIAVSGSWAGYVDGGHTYNATEGQWYVPQTTGTVSPLPDVVGTWIGLGGWVPYGTPTDLFQTGTNSGYNSAGQAFGDAFVEYYPGEAAQNLFAVSPGDVIQAYATYAGSGAYYYQIDDSTNGLGSGNYIYPTWGAGNPNSADFIAENVGYQLPGFNFISFWNTQAEVGSSLQNAQYWPAQYIEERSTNGDLTPTSFQGDPGTGSVFQINRGDSNTSP